jgi:hypothetical protein
MRFLRKNSKSKISATNRKKTVKSVKVSAKQQPPKKHRRSCIFAFNENKRR